MVNFVRYVLHEALTGVTRSLINKEYLLEEEEEEEEEEKENFQRKEELVPHATHTRSTRKELVPHEID